MLPIPELGLGIRVLGLQNGTPWRCVFVGFRFQQSLTFCFNGTSSRKISLELWETLEKL